MPIAVNWKRRGTVHFWLTCLVLACVVPVWLGAAGVVWYAYQSKREGIEFAMLESARGLSQAVDRELEVVQAALEALATSPSIDASDFAAFHAQALDLLKGYKGADIILADASGQQMVNTYRPVGSVLPKRGASDAVRRVFGEGKPIVTGVFKGAVTGRFLIGVDVPVKRGGTVVYDLGMALPLDRMTAILADRKLPAEWVGLILDGNRVAVARTLYPERYVGMKIPPLLLNRPNILERTAPFVNLDNVPAIAAISKSSLTGWAAVVHVPRSVITTAIREWLAWVVGGTILLSCMGVALAVLIGRSISRSIHALIPMARELAAGRPVQADGLGLDEADAVAEALGSASLLLKERTENLERSNRELEEFASVASHDLQEPLRKIKAFGDRLHEGYAHLLDEEGKDFLSRMENAADRMHTLIMDLLEYSRVTTRPSPFVKADLGEIVREAQSDLEESIVESGAEIVVDELPTVEVDVSQMRRVFQNLLSNAIKFRSDKPARIRVSGLATEKDGQGMATILVRDNGIGFEEQYSEKIFQPFQRLHGRSRYKGTGIGLAIVRKSVERHGGTVTAQSRPGLGSTFRVDIPLTQPKADK